MRVIVRGVLETPCCSGVQSEGSGHVLVDFVSFKRGGERVVYSHWRPIGEV
jgi:hypothetical protein